MQEWYVPITILPGICLLILSTSNIMMDLSSEIKALIVENNKEESSLIERKLRQLKLINQAMVLLYASVISFIISALLSGLSANMDLDLSVDFYVLLFGIIIAMMALISLILYSFRAVKIRQGQYHKKVE